jgi:hypothetical protein
MSLHGHIENGVVVFTEPVPLPNGTPVRVEAIVAAPVDFWKGATLEELAAQQGVAAPKGDDVISGGWPEDELDDGFEDVLARWRQRELEQL